MRITFFGSSITSAYWNGAATYYRGICRALHRHGHNPVFVEQDIYDRQQHRDLIEDPEYAEVVVCRDRADLDRELARASQSDLVVKCSGVGRYDEYLDAAVLETRTSSNRIAYWDVDAPFTLDQAHADPSWYFRNLIPRYDAVITYGGGPRVEEGYKTLGARTVELVYNALDPEAHHPVPVDPEYECDLLFVGNRLPDREARVREFFLRVAEGCPQARFLFGGEGWGDLQLPSNVQYLGPVPTGLHNRLNCSARLVLNVNRQSMADYGFSPPTRVFEAAGAGACLVSDHWDGIDRFLTPGEEVLVASTPEDVAAYVLEISQDQAAGIGRRALTRILRDHTYDRRGDQLQAFLPTLF
ncbi:MAG TPA: glycosyltransferase, partial [Chloroflexota bacterium]|nr:glycosyltransferase [Chloroflexota bacterium]